jgi:hypothetical protein
MAAHRKSNRRSDNLCAVGLRKNELEMSCDRFFALFFDTKRVGGTLLTHYAKLHGSEVKSVRRIAGYDVEGTPSV